MTHDHLTVAARLLNDIAIDTAQGEVRGLAYCGGMARIEPGESVDFSDD